MEIFDFSECKYSNRNGSYGSSVSRFSKEQPRLAQNIEKMYVNGVFGGLPRFEESFNEVK